MLTQHLFGTFAPGEAHCGAVDCVSTATIEAVNAMYTSAFSSTQIQTRYPANWEPGLGLYDGSFGHSTVGDPSWYF
jgi:hypothetical protein